VKLGVEGIHTVEEAVSRFQSLIWYYAVEEAMLGIGFLLQVFLLGCHSSFNERMSCVTQQVEILYIGGF